MSPETLLPLAHPALVVPLFYFVWRGGLRVMDALWNTQWRPLRRRLRPGRRVYDAWSAPDAPVRPVPATCTEVYRVMR